MRDEIKINEPIYNNMFKDLYFDLILASSGETAIFCLRPKVGRLLFALLNNSAKNPFPDSVLRLFKNRVTAPTRMLAIKTAISISLPSINTLILMVKMQSFKLILRLKVLEESSKIL